VNKFASWNIPILTNSSGSSQRVQDVARRIGQPNLELLIRHYLQAFAPQRDHFHPVGRSDSAVDPLPHFRERITVYPSAVAKYYSPSDISGIGGMRKDRIHAVDKWFGGAGRYDTVYLKEALDEPATVPDFQIARVHLLFAFVQRGRRHACALIQDFVYVDSEPDEDVGMWVVCRAFRGSQPKMRVIPLTLILRSAHLLPDFQGKSVPRDHIPESSLNTYHRFFLNKFIDHHSFELHSTK
jgi:hypothetical protein